MWISLDVIMWFLLLNHTKEKHMIQILSGNRLNSKKKKGIFCGSVLDWRATKGLIQNGLTIYTIWGSFWPRKTVRCKAIGRTWTIWEKLKRFKGTIPQNIDEDIFSFNNIRQQHCIMTYLLYTDLCFLLNSWIWAFPGFAFFSPPTLMSYNKFLWA